MAVDKQLYLPISILLGCSIVATGLFLGLRERSPARPEETAASTRGAGDARGAPPAPPATPAPTADRAAAARAAEAALEAQRAAIVARCIPPDAKGGGPSRLHINITFDASGTQIMRGVVPERTDPRRELAGCVTDALPSLTIPPQASSVALDLVWTLP
jgi:hypothetical protein